MIIKILVKGNSRGSWYLVNPGESITSANSIHGTKAEMLQVARVKGYQITHTTKLREGLQQELITFV